MAKAKSKLQSGSSKKSRRVALKKRLPRQPAWAPPADYTIDQVLAERWRELGYERVPVKVVEPACKELSRWDVPVTLPGTGMFSGYEELGGEITIVRLLRSTPWLYRPLRDAVRHYFDTRAQNGPKKMAGCFALAFVAMVESGEADVKPWFSATSPELWRECGFTRMPSYKTVQRTFKELEEIQHIFADTLRRLVQHVRKREPRIGHAVAIDATMAESNARPHKLAAADGSLPDRIGKLPVLASSRMPTTMVDEMRRAANTAPPNAGPIQVGEYIDITPMIVSDVRGKYRIFGLKSGVYISRDIDAGMCAYTRGGKLLKWWYGYLLTQGIDHFTGLPLEAHGFSADQAEFHHYEPVVEKAIDTLGRVPHFISADKGMSYTDCFEWSVERGITLVAPYRKANGVAPDKAQPTVHFDQHGVPFCRSCGGGTDQLSFHVEEAQGVKGKPRPILRVRCAAPQSKECLGPQEWNCRVDPARLLPVWRTHPAYSAVRKRHQEFERAHNEARTRANAKPRHFETRTKRVSLDLAIMRMNVYALIAWLRASVINGWLGTPALNPELERLAARHRRLDTNTQATFINHNVILARLRRGLVGGGRVPHRNRGGPPRAAPGHRASANS